ncbi:MAG TPA: helix-turn-helix domain-containing protein [Streptosporangiaceae bacterium]|nr:helix-turn-helix domain-containing protein [Streptosporangiaceae bacterium]
MSENRFVDEAAIADGAAATVVNEQVWRAPAAGLRGLVDSYIGYRHAGIEPGRHRGLPSPYLTLIFTLNESLDILAHPDPAQPSDSYDSLVGGLHTVPAIITHDGRQSGIQLAVGPLGARALLGVPAGELAGHDFPAEDVLGPRTREISDRLRSAANWAERFDVLDQALMARLARADDRTGVDISAEVSFTWRRLLASGGSAPVSALAAETGWSERHLRSMFRAETGLSPKAAARVIRFDRARRALQRRAAAGERLALADIAASCGYFDQAHLDREFGLIAGCSPTRWLAEEFRNFQAAAA